MNIFKVSLLGSIFMMLSCTSEQLIGPDDSSNHARPSTTSLEDGALQGVIRVKLSEDIGSNMSLSSVNGKVTCSNANIANYLHSLGTIKMTRVFPYAGKYEGRSRKCGLHLWYDIEFDKSKPIAEATMEAKSIPGIEIVEKIYAPRLSNYQVIQDVEKSVKSLDTQFNDPSLSKQWHYKNYGKTPKSIAGADINLFDAWKIETGKPNVIVAVVDGGVDYQHEDLKDNMYVNTAELNGKPGIDDDNNGFVDDIYGYNFYDNQGKIEPHPHGTHVAGTIAARNNNGKGVCGIAGGDGTANSGVRIMSCQIFPPQKSENNGDAAAAIKYAADNGAVICQNSWGFPYPGLPSLPGSLKAAIDYFIRYAGCDQNGNQRPESPMKGGVVIFAAGNDNQEFMAYPAAYSAVVSVSAMAPNFHAAWYSNRGSWVNIMAPGGDEFFPQGMVYSTLPNNKYGYEQGTSMACPHVSGIAALIASHFGKQGFTNEDLKSHLLTAVRPYDINKYNPEFKDLLGVGYIDAYEALRENQHKAPAAVTNVSSVSDFIKLDLSWNAVSDQDDKTAFAYYLYYSPTKTLSADNYKEGNVVEISGLGHDAGERIDYALEKLQQNTNYHFALVAVDRWGLTSAPYFFSAKTKQNFPPSITRLDSAKIRLTEDQTAWVKLLVKEPEGQKWGYKVNGMSTGVDVRLNRDTILIHYRALAPYGEYTTHVVVSDILGAKSEIDIPFEIYKNRAPKLTQPFSSLYLPIGKSFELDLSKHFIDEDGQPITFEATSSNPSTLGVKVKGQQLLFNPARKGNVTINLKVSDPYHAFTVSHFNVMVVKEQLVYVVYPIPAKKVLNVILSPSVQTGTLSILSHTGNQVFSKTIQVNSEQDKHQQINVSKLASGTYILKVEANGKTFKEAFVKL